MTRLAADWLAAPATRAVFALLTEPGYQAFFVGGCVRDALLGVRSADIDIATDAAPEAVLDQAARAGIRAVPTGLSHGTVTLIAAGRGFEVTTFRRDIETHGRHATVAFGTDIAADAARRDFTMNALYARPDGEVLDPLGGLPDLRARRVRFVGDPATRIAEDYLRILRFFRFHAWFGDPEGGLDPAALAACAAAQEQLDRLSRERVGAETRKLLAAPDPAPAVAAMAATGILARLLPGADPAALAPLVHLEAAGGHPPRWQRRLAALGDAAGWAEALRFSKAERKALAAITAALAEPSVAVAAYRHGAEAAFDAALIRAATLGVPPPPALGPEIERGAGQRFPLAAADLALRGPALGGALRRLEAAWIASDFALTRDELLARVVAPGGVTES